MNYLTSLGQLMTQLEEQSRLLDKNKKALERTYEELDQYAYIASHDLRSPLRNISGYAQLLKKRYYNSLDTEANEFIDFIVKYTQQMSDILSELLQYNKIDKETSFTFSDTLKICELAKLSLTKQIIENRATIIFENLPCLYLQKDAFLLLIEHLIENALIFRTAEPPVIHISAVTKTNGRVWEFSVKDNGVGLEEAYQHKAFLPFQRINHRDRPGIGMGLAICRKVVKIHNGDIWYTQNTEGGTTFHFTISQVIS